MTPIASPLRVTILNRDFTTPPIQPYNFQVQNLSWTATGGSYQGLATAHSTPDRIVEFASLLACPVQITDDTLDPCWVGYISRIDIAFDNVIFSIDTAELFNRVKVRYTYISPDGKLSEIFETDWSSDDHSLDTYGTREAILTRQNVDDMFATSLRNTYLNTQARPGINLLPARTTSSKLDLQQTTITLHLSSWFHTLRFKYYQELEGLYANHGPGPGAQVFGNGTTSQVAQSFRPNKSVSIRYAFALLRKVGSPTSNITAELFSDSAGSPGALLATSAGTAGSGLHQQSYTWVKFTFASAINLAPFTRYWIAFHGNTSSATHHYQIRVDENLNFIQPDEFARHRTTSWVLISSVTNPGSRVNLFFRVVATEDSGSVLGAIAKSCHQFFTRITSFQTGVVTTPYRNNGKTCLDEIFGLLYMGTSNHLRVLADVTPSRELIFYEQPPPTTVGGYMDRFGRFYTPDMKPLPAWRPPIGKNVVLTTHDRVHLPFDFMRSPSYFVDQFTYKS